MTKENTFVALKSFRFGADVLQPGDTVPMEAGRDYQLMLRLGQIAPAGSVTQTAGGQQKPDPQELTTFEKGEEVLVVYDDGTYERAEFVSFAEADDAAREALELDAGDLVATVTVDDEPLTVPLGSVLPRHPVGKLLDYLEGRARENHETVLALGAAELRIRAMLEPGDPLPDDLPGKKEVEAYGIRTMGGLKLLATDVKGKANLTGIPGVGDKTADKLLAALNLPAGT